MDEIAPLTPSDDVVYLELLDKHDGLVARHRFDHLPVTLGAAYDNDHIVDVEPSNQRRPVAASIARSADGLLMVIATDGASDISVSGDKTRLWRVDPDQVFLLGGQRFRVRTRSYEGSLQAMSSASTVLPGLGRGAVLWALPLALACGAFTTWLVDIDGQVPTAYVSVALVTLGMLSVWSGLWALLSRLTGHAGHFLAHLSLAALAVVAVIVLDYGFDTAAFAFSLPMIQRYDYALLGVIVGVLVWCHARLVNRLHARTAMATALAVGGTVLAFQALPAYTARGSLASTATLTELRPPALRVANAVSTERFFADNQALKAKTELSRAEKPDGFDSGAGVDE